MKKWILTLLLFSSMALGQTQFENPYFDSHGLVTMQKSIRVENGILFLAYWAKLRKLNKALTKDEIHIIKDSLRHSIYFEKGKMRFQANPPERGSHYSRDNMWGLYYLWDLVGWDVYELPVYRWNSRQWYHPNGWAMHLYKRGFPYNVLMWPLLQGMKSYSDWTQKPGETSGDLLWWLMWEDESENQLEDFIWYVTFAKRRNNLDNPILIEAKKLWK